MKKKLAAMLLTICMILSLFPSVPAFAAGIQDEETIVIVPEQLPGDDTVDSQQVKGDNDLQSDEINIREFPEGETAGLMSAADPSEVSDFGDTGFSVSTSGDYPWTVAQKDGVSVLSAHSETSDRNVLSSMEIAFSETGVFSFEYSTATAEGNGTVYYSYEPFTATEVGSKPINKDKVSDFSGTHDWTTINLNVTAGQTLYFGYVNKRFDTGTVWLRNLSLSTGGFTVAVNSNNETYGTAEASAYSVEADAADKKVTLTAHPQDTCRFYGWVENGKFLSNKATYVIDVQTNRSITAWFGAEDEYEARVDGIFYESVEDAIGVAGGTASSPAFVVLTNDASISGTVVLNPYTVFVLPYSDADATVQLDEETDERPYSNSAKASPASTSLTQQGESVHYTLIVENGASLSVPSTSVLSVGGIYSGGQPIGGQVCGAHSEIDVEGTLNVNGILSCCGYIYGNGRMNITGGVLYENFTVTDFNGGGVFLQDATQGLFPFTTYTVMGVQCETSFDANSLLKAYCALYVSSSIMQIPVEVVGGSKALIQINSGTAVMTYDKSKAFPIYDKNGNVIASIGTLHIKLNGDAAIGAMKLSLAGLSFNTQEFECPLPYCITIEQESGTLNVGAKLKIMPGSELIVGKDAELNITSGGSLNALVDSTTGSSNIYKYPDMNALMQKGYFPVAEVVVAGTLTAEDSSGIGGLIMVLDGGKVEVSEYADTSSLNSMNMLLNVSEDELVVGSPAFLQLMGTYAQAMNNDPTAGAALMQRSAQIEGGNTYVAEEGSFQSSEFEEVTYIDTITFVDDDYIDYVNEHGSADGYEPLAVVTQERHTALSYPGTLPSKAPVEYDINYNAFPFVGWNKVVVNPLGQLQQEREGDLMSQGDIILYEKLPEVSGDTIYMAAYGDEWKYFIYTYSFVDGVDDAEIAMPQPIQTNDEGYACWNDIEVPTYPGHTFAGWKAGNTTWTSNPNGNNYNYKYVYDVSNYADENRNVVWTAQWTINTYTVTWVDDNNQVIETDNNVAYFSKPSFDGTEPTKDGFTFIGWQDADGNVLTEDTVITGDTVYSPVWRATEVLTESNFVINAKTVDSGGVSIGITDSVNGVFTVSSNNDLPCVVAVDNGDGTYTRLDCSTTNNIHTFTCPAGFDENISIVVALKGDITQDGRVNSRDTNSLSNHNLGNTLISDSFQLLLCDVNQDGRINSRDTNALSNNNLGNTSFVW